MNLLRGMGKLAITDLGGNLGDVLQHLRADGLGRVGGHDEGAWFEPTRN